MIDTPNAALPPTIDFDADVLTVKEASRLLRICPSLLYTLCAQRKIEHFRCGLGRGTIRITKQALRDYLDRSKSAAISYGQGSSKSFNQLNSRRLAEAWKQQGVL
jgi:excisionase family DNA binding protein